MIENTRICPECGQQIESSSDRCMNCGYQFRKEKTIVESKTKAKMVPTIILLVGAAVCFVIAFTRLNDNYYKYCVSIQQEYQEEYAEAKAFTDENNAAIFSTGNRLINEGWQDLISNNQKTIWEHRIQAIVLCVVGVILLIVFVFIRKRER